MKRNTTAAYALALMSLFAVATAGAQTAPAPRAAVLDGIQSSVTKSIGAEAKSVEITLTDTVLTALRVNSNLNGSSHGGRNNEAIAIADIASDAIGKSPEFARVHTIRVQYIKRSTENSVTIVDTVEFRKNAKGVFEIHVS